ncbi:unnamed protein product [Rodentolepis nana]|uniref:Cmyb_C domain-containing protein n=1 Tax=Rodentolepis nana TaxID=102285 RepID=A0A0R3T8N7_RODNA|nr:unnamed protein product [Rodentolepis nana]
MKSISHKHQRFLPLPELVSLFGNKSKCHLELFLSSSSRQLDSSRSVPHNIQNVSSDDLPDFNSIKPDSMDTIALRGTFENMLSQLDNTLAENSNSFHTLSSSRLRSAPSMAKPVSIPERNPTPPPFLPPPTALSHRPTSVPLFNHSYELSHHFTKSSCLPGVGASVSCAVTSAPPLCEILIKPELQKQAPISGFQRHTNDLLIITEAEERALRGRLNALRNEMERDVESEGSTHSSDVSRRDFERTNGGTASVNSSASVTLAQVEDSLSSIIKFCTTTTSSDSGEQALSKSTVVYEDSLKVVSKFTA